MKRWLFGIAGCAGALFMAQLAFGASSEMEILLKKLQEKGVLSSEEATSIAAETKKAAAESKEKEAKASELPDWIKNAKFKGDLRLRYQNEDKDDNGQGSRGRGRIRLRAGVDTKVTDDVTVGFGLATGSGDPRSTNQTLQDTFSKKDITIDYAYASYRPHKAITLWGGKFQNPIWRPSDLLWDSDITPEGAGLQVAAPVGGSFSLLFNGGAFILDERSADKDPLMYTFQPGVNWNFTKNGHLKVMAAYYLFSNVKGNALDNSSGTNTLNAANLLRYDYDAPAFSAEIGFKNPFGVTFVPYVGLFGEYIKNPDADRDDTGYIAGVTVGHQSLKKLGDWSLEYTYRRLGKDAWLDTFPDSDFLGGATNTVGHRVKLGFGLTKNVSLGLSYFDSSKIRNYNPAKGLVVPAATRNIKSDEKLVQADLILKF